MGDNPGFKLKPALVAGPGVHHGLGPEGFGSSHTNHPPHALALSPIYNLEASSKPMTLPPFEIRLTNPSSLVKYPFFPATD